MSWCLEFSLDQKRACDYSKATDAMAHVPPVSNFIELRKQKMQKLLSKIKQDIPA